MTSAVSTNKTPAQGSNSTGSAVETTETVLVTTHGKTSIADVVVEKIAGLAAREITGVYKLGGGGASRAFGAIREKIPGGGSGLTAGVAIERMTTLEVTEVNIVVHDVHVPNQDTDEPVDSRVE